MKMPAIKLNKIPVQIMKYTSGVCFRSTAAFADSEPAKSTIEDSEVEKLSKLSSTWWDDDGELRALHSMNKIRVPFIRDCLLYTKTGSINSADSPHPLKDFKVIDVGCGGGILSEPLARIGAQVTGLDASESLIAVAQEHLNKDQKLNGMIEYVCGSIEDHAKDKTEVYDAVVASEVLEHVVQKDLFLEACSNVLKPGGSIIITSLNRTMAAWVAGVITAEYILHLVPQETHDWEKFIAPHEAQYILEKHGCYTKLVHGLFYNFICNEWFWTPNTQINYALHAVKKK